QRRLQLAALVEDVHAEAPVLRVPVAQVDLELLRELLAMVLGEQLAGERGHGIAIESRTALKRQQMAVDPQDRRNAELQVNVGCPVIDAFAKDGMQVHVPLFLPAPPTPRVRRATTFCTAIARLLRRR